MDPSDAGAGARRATACASCKMPPTIGGRRVPSRRRRRAAAESQGMTLTLGHFLSLGAILFALSVIGIFLNRRT